MIIVSIDLLILLIRVWIVFNMLIILPDNNAVYKLIGYINACSIGLNDMFFLIGRIDIKKAWLKALKESGIDHCRFHDLRHTAASNLVRAGRTLFEVATLLGHSSIQMTQRYSHLAIQDTLEMVDKEMGGLK